MPSTHLQSLAPAFPPSVAPKGNNLTNDIKLIGRSIDTDSILKEYKLYQKGALDIKKIILSQESPMVFGLNKTGSPHIQVLHSMATLEVNLFQKAEYKGENIGFVGNRVHGVETIPIIITIQIWNWT